MKFQDYTAQSEGNLKIKFIKRPLPVTRLDDESLSPSKRTEKKQSDGVDGIASNKKSLRRTKSVGSLPKKLNETTPKKAKTKERKACSERKPYLRSDTLKAQSLGGPAANEPLINNINVSSVMKNLSSPLKQCDVKVILEEQLRIEKMLEQEKKDLELARRMEAEWNARPPRRASAKRAPAPAPTLAPAPPPPKRLRV